MPIVSSFSGDSARGTGLFGRTVDQITSITDNFNRSNSSSLGFTSDGKAQWSVLSGSFSISSNRATSSGTSGVAVVDLGASNVSASLSLSWGGDALYFRVTDANNWWRVATYFDQVQVNTPYSYNTWSYDTVVYQAPIPGGAYGCGPANHGHPDLYPFKTAVYSVATAPPTFCYSPVSHSHIVGFPNCSTPFGTPGTIYLDVPHTHPSSCTYVMNGPFTGVDTQTYNIYYVVLEKAVSGSITTVRSFDSSSASTVTSVQVTANGSSITVKYNGSNSNLFSAVSDSTHSTATKHGIGRRNPVDASSSAMDNFSVSRL